MKSLLRYCLAFLTTVGAAMAIQAEEPHIAREAIEWCNVWIPAASRGLPFLLLSDQDGSLRKAFQVPKTLGILPGRVTYVIDKAGIVRHVFSALLFGERHVAEALKIVREVVREMEINLAHADEGESP
jgi:alkyl hydroperoxide reductase subunit AhpC